MQSLFVIIEQILEIAIQPQSLIIRSKSSQQRNRETNRANVEVVKRLKTVSVKNETQMARRYLYSLRDPKEVHKVNQR